MAEENYLEIKSNNENRPKIILPSERRAIKNKRMKRLAPYFKTIKWTLIISLLIFLYLFYQPILLYFNSILQANPTVYQYYLYIEAQIKNNTLTGLFFLAILGSLFFLALPSEAIFIYFISSSNFPFYLVIAIAVLGNITGLLINYFIGKLMGEKLLKFFFKKNFFSYKEKIIKWGGIVLFIGNIFPGPIEILSIFYGAFRFNLKNYIFLAFMGRLIKFTLLFLAYTFFWTDIMYFWTEIMKIF